MNTFFLAPTGADAALGAASLAVLRALQQSGLRVGFFKPVGQPEGAADRSTDLANAVLKLNAPAALPLERVEHLLALGETDQLMEEIVVLYHRAAEGVDVMVVEGVEHDGLFAAALNTKLARNLNARILLVASGEASARAIARQIELTAQAFHAEQGQIEGYILTGLPQGKAAAEAAAEIRQAGNPLQKRPLALLGAVAVDAGGDSLDAIDAAAANLDGAALKACVEASGEPRMPPPVFRYQLMEKARKAAKRIVLPEGDEPRTIKAAAICQEKGIARCVLLGDRAEIERVAAAQGVTLPEGLEIIDPADVRGRYVDPMVEMRKSKGLTPEDAEKQLEDTVVLGTVMLALDEVDGLVSGAVHTTANTIRPALQLIKTAPGSKMVSSVFFMLMPDQVFVYGDCAVNPNPSAEDLADIAIQSADSAAAFGIVPRVAMISYSTGTSGGGPDVEKVAEATRIAREKRPDLAIDGPLQYDAASVESVGRQKAPDSPVAGRATVFVFPDLNTGNTTYKAVQRSANLVSVGPMLQGLRKPVNDLSRGALVDDIVYTIALTAIQGA